MLENNDIFDGLLGLREALAEYLDCGVALEAPTVGVFVATIDAALARYQAEQRESEFDRLVKRGAQFRAEHGMIAPQGGAAPQGEAPQGNVVTLRPRGLARLGGGDAE